MASEYESSILESLEESGTLYLKTQKDLCILDVANDAEGHTLTREQMYILSDEIRTIADGMEFLTCDGSENE